MNPQLLSKINRGRPYPAPKSIPWSEIASTPQRVGLIIDYLNRLQVMSRKKGGKNGKL